MYSTYYLVGSSVVGTGKAYVDDVVTSGADAVCDLVPPS